MTIYNRYGKAVELIEAKLIVVWVRSSADRVDWLFCRTHSRPMKGISVEERPQWFVRANFQESGQPICDGLLVDANLLRADGGWPEISGKLKELAPTDAAKYLEWDHVEAPPASAFFGQVSPREVFL